MPSATERLLDEVAHGRRLAFSEALELLVSADLPVVAEAADRVTERLHPEPYRTYNVDRNINYTNICVGGCRFCAFSRKPGDSAGYILSREELYRKIEETLALGGDQILLQGGMHPELPLAWYESLVRDIRARYPAVNVHGFSPSEIYHISQVSGLTVDTVLNRLREAGLGSLPGGGAEILVDRVRRAVSRCKVSTDGWLDVCRRWHRLGGHGSATMMFGHLETPAERIEHLERLRSLQDETAGFTAFICWTFQPGNTELSEIRKLGSAEYLKMLAVSRLYLDNFPNVQASWVTQGLKVGQMSLRFGANDMGSVMIEENVVAAAGTSFRADEAAIRHAIVSAGFIPRRRNVRYELTDEPPHHAVKGRP